MYLSNPFFAELYILILKYPILQKSWYRKFFLMNPSAQTEQIYGKGARYSNLTDTIAK